MISKFIFFALLISLLHVSFDKTYAEEAILISISSNLDKLTFDGKWTNSDEWKQSSYNRLHYDDGAEIHLRTAHQDDFVYIQINFASDMIIDKYADSAIVCFDTQNDKTILPQSDENFIAIGAASDKVDRYNKTPHASYEFKIPLDVIGRSSNYGFYISVFDKHSQNHYSWPYDIQKQSLISIPSPSKWGELISPDKSLPEFSFSSLFLLIIPLIILIVIIPKFQSYKLNLNH